MTIAIAMTIVIALNLMIDVYFSHLSTNEGLAECLRARARVLAFVPMEKHDARPALDRARVAREESSSACVFMRAATLFRVVGDRGRRAASTSVGRRGASVSRASESSARGRRRGCASSANSRRGRVLIPCARPSGTSEREVKSAPEVDDGEVSSSSRGEKRNDDDAFRRWLFEQELPAMGKKTLKSLSSLPLAIGELLIIAGFSALGTVIEQNKSYSWYVENYPTENPTLGFLDFPVILDFGLDHIYTTWYFLGLLGLLGASLTACTVTRQWPVWKVAAKWKFLDRRAALLAMDESESVPRARLDDFSELLAERGYQVFLKGEKMYAFKGLIGRLAPIGVHAALLFTLGGAAYSGLGGLSGSVMVPDGSSFDIASGLSRGSLLSSMPSVAKSTVQVNDFTIEYLPSGAVSQFYSDLSVVDPKGKEMSRKTISVNVPLRVGGVTMYQTDWALSSMQVTVETPSPADDDVSGGSKQTYVLPMASLEGKAGFEGRIWGTFLPLDFEGDQNRGISLVARDFQSVAVYDSSGGFIGVRRPESKKPIVVDGLKIVVGDVKGSTGLELKTDPGVPLVYAGFAGLMVTSFLSLLSHSQIWAIQEETAIVVGGKTNRAKEEFRTELDEVLNSVPEYVDF